MIARFEARYPFLNAAREFAVDNGIELDTLLTSDSYADARERGARRVEDAIINSEVSYNPLRNEIEAAMEIITCSLRIPHSIRSSRNSNLRFSFSRSRGLYSCL